MKLIVKKGRTSLLTRIFIQDSSSTIGAGLTGLTNASGSLTCYRARDDDGNAGATAISLSAGTKGTWSSGGFVEKDSTNMPGWYEFGVPDAAIATGSESVDIELKGATNMAPCNLEIQLVAFDPQDSVRAGLTALPNAAAGATNGLPLSVDSSGRVDVLKINGTSQTARDIGASVLLSAGTGTGQLDFTSGVVKANLAQILGTALTETAGQIAAAFKKLFDVASPVLTATSVNQTGDNYARLGAPAGASVSADIAAAKVDTAAIKVQTDKITFTVANQVDANVKDWAGTAVATPNTAGVPVVDTRAIARQSTAQATGNSTTAIKLDASASATTDYYKGMRCTVISGTGAPQSGLVTAYDGTTKIATISPAWPTAPDNTSIFQVLMDAQADVETWKGSAAPAMTGDAYARLGAPAGASVSADIAAVKTDVDALPSAATIATTVWASVMETGYSALQGMRLIMAALLGKASGMATTTATFRDVNDTANRIVATVDSNGNRSAVTLTP